MYPVSGRMGPRYRKVLHRSNTEIGPTISAPEEDSIHILYFSEHV
jgi:hypothetical protein